MKYKYNKKLCLFIRHSKTVSDSRVVQHGGVEQNR